MILQNTPKRKRRANRRKSSSRQRKQQHILEVRARSRMAKKQRNRFVFTVLCRLILLIILLGGAYYGSYKLLQKLFFANAEYTLTSLKTEVSGSISEDHIIELSGIEPGCNIFSVSLDNVRERIEKDQQVSSVEVERRLPDTIILRVVEREPVAWVTSLSDGMDPYTSPHTYLIDTRGILMKTNKLYTEYLHLPLITGVSKEDLVGSRSMDSVGLKAAIDLIVYNKTRVTGSPFEIRAIDLSKGYCMVVTDAHHSKFVFPLNNLDTQMEKLELLLAHAKTIGREIEHVNLIPRRNIPVRFGSAQRAPDMEQEAGETELDAAPPVRRAIPVVE